MIIMATRLRTTGPGDWFCCGGRFAVSAVFFCPRFLIDFGNDSNHRQKEALSKPLFLSPEADLKFLIHQFRNSEPVAENQAAASTAANSRKAVRTLIPREELSGSLIFTPFSRA